MARVAISIALGAAELDAVLSVSPDGTTLYTEAGGNLLAYDVGTGALLHTYSGNGHGPDGTPV